MIGNNILYENMYVSIMLIKISGVKMNYFNPPPPPPNYVYIGHSFSQTMWIKMLDLKILILVVRG